MSGIRASQRAGSSKAYQMLTTTRSITEILDVAPIDAIYALSKETADRFPDTFLPPQLRAQSLDLKVHWVSETGKTPISLTSKISMNPTVSRIHGATQKDWWTSHLSSHKYHQLTSKPNRTHTKAVPLLISCSLAPRVWNTSPVRRI